MAALCTELENSVHIKQKADRLQVISKLKTMQSLDTVDMEEGQLVKDVANMFNFKYENEETRAKREWEGVLAKTCRMVLQILENPEIKSLPRLGVLSTYFSQVVGKELMIQRERLFNKKSKLEQIKQELKSNLKAND